MSFNFLLHDDSSDVTDADDADDADDHDDDGYATNELRL